MPLLPRHLFFLGQSFAWLELRERVIRLQTVNGEVGLAQELKLSPTDLAVYSATLLYDQSALLVSRPCTASKLNNDNRGITKYKVTKGSLSYPETSVKLLSVRGVISNIDRVCTSMACEGHRSTRLNNKSSQLAQTTFFFWIRLLILIGELLELKNIKEDTVEKCVGRKFAVSEPEVTENGNSNDRLWQVS